MTQRTPSYKIIIIGDSGVGKSSLLVRFVRNEYHEKTRSTVSAAYLTRRVEAEGRTVQFEIWDTAGQERFRSLNTPMYYRGAAGAVIVYDVTDPASFKNAKGWYSQLKMLGEPDVQVMLVGNKADLSDEGEDGGAAPAAAANTGTTTGVATGTENRAPLNEATLSTSARALEAAGAETDAAAAAAAAVPPLAPPQTPPQMPPPPSRRPLSPRAATRLAADVFAAEHGLCGHWECSARTGAQVEEAFAYLATRVSPRPSPAPAAPTAPPPIQIQPITCRGTTSRGPCC